MYTTAVLMKLRMIFFSLLFIKKNNFISRIDSRRATIPNCSGPVSGLGGGGGDGLGRGRNRGLHRRARQLPRRQVRLGEACQHCSSFRRAILSKIVPVHANSILWSCSFSLWNINSEPTLKKMPDPDLIL